MNEYLLFEPRELSLIRKPTRSRDDQDSRQPAATQRAAGAVAELRSPGDATSDAQLLSEVIVQDTDPGRFHIASWKNVLLVRWESAADSAAVERLAKVSATMAAANPAARRSNIHVICDGAGLPTPTARAGFIDLMKEHADRLVCIAIVIEGTGFLASAMRSLLTGMRLLSPRSFNYRLHGSVEEAVKFLPAEHLARTGEELDPRRLARVVALWAKMGSASQAAQSP